MYLPNFVVYNLFAKTELFGPPHSQKKSPWKLSTRLLCHKLTVNNFVKLFWSWFRWSVSDGGKNRLTGTTTFRKPPPPLNPHFGKQIRDEKSLTNFFTELWACSTWKKTTGNRYSTTLLPFFFLSPTSQIYAFQCWMGHRICSSEIIWKMALRKKLLVLAFRH